MNLDLDRSIWERVRLGDVVRNLNETVKDAESVGIDRVIALEHLDPGELQISRWGDVADGTTFTKRVRPGQTLFGKRRAYQRKAAYAEFEAIASGDILVFEANPNRMLPELLPFLVQSEPFFAHALNTSAGSLSPRTNWGALAKFEFDLPPLDEQQRIADLLWEAERLKLHLDVAVRQGAEASRSWLHELFSSAAEADEVIELDQLIDPTRPICYGILMPGPEVPHGPLVVDVKDYPRGAIEIASVRRTSPQIESGFTRSRIRSGDVLLSIRGTVGRVAIVPEELDGQNISRDSARLSGDPDVVLPGFLRLVLLSPDVQSEIARMTTGLAVKGINVARIRAIKVPSWSLGAQREAVDRMELLETTVAQVRRERDSLVAVSKAIASQVFEGAV